MTNDEAANWVTVRIHESVRDEARALDPTYTEIMQAGIDAVQENSEPIEPTPETQSYEVGDLKESLAETLNASKADVDPEKIAREISKQLDYTLLANKTAEEMEGRLR